VFILLTHRFSITGIFDVLGQENWRHILGPYGSNCFRIRINFGVIAKSISASTAISGVNISDEWFFLLLFKSILEDLIVFFLQRHSAAYM
jgi:hypothetical protein